MSRFILLAFAMLAVPGVFATVSLDVAVDRLDDQGGVPIPLGALVLLVADTDGDGLGQAAAGDISLRAYLDGFGGDDLIVFRSDLAALATPGAYGVSTGGLELEGIGSSLWSEGDPLYLVWFPGLSSGDSSVSAGEAYGARDLGVTPPEGGNEALVYVAPANTGIFGGAPVPPASSNLRANRSVGSSFDPPTVVAPTALSITENGAILGGEVTADNGSPAEARGVVYSIVSVNSEPEIGGSGVTSISSGSGLGAFSQPVGGLSSGVTYAYRAFATNAGGNGYSATAVFTTDSQINLVAGIGSVARDIHPGDQHRFRFTLTTAKVANLTTGGVPLRARLYNSVGTLIAEHLIAGDVSLLALPLGPGTYTLDLIRDPGIGAAQAYALSVNATATALAKIDGAVGASLVSTVGNNVYAPSVQRVTLTSLTGQPVTGYVTATNRGNIRDRVVMRGSITNPEFSVNVFDEAGGNITAQIVAGTYITPEMQPLASPAWIRMVVSPSARAVQLGRNFTPYIYLNSGFNGNVGDRLSILVKTR